ncbi:Hypothetical predicted protein [Octopus vulgaris]|uniref:Uncharacterized protein n=1 Tax=Octopus vulgaris TaxID=6645 RepID=A0AA36BZJ5_OCTVU|nr:Hypothetical predicted protein [Octopus vulgaris]
MLSCVRARDKCPNKLKLDLRMVVFPLYLLCGAYGCNTEREEYESPERICEQSRMITRQLAVRRRVSAVNHTATTDAYVVPT